MANKKQIVSNWMKDNWFKLVIVVLFIVFIFVLQAGLSNISSNLSDIDFSVAHIR